MYTLGMKREYLYAPSYRFYGPKISLNRLYRQAKRNALRRDIPFDLTEADLQKLYEEGGGRCAISGIMFNKTVKVGRCRPYAPSIDRIESGKGYSFDNCRLVCVAVNLAIGDFGLEVLEHVAIGMFDHAKFNPRVMR